MATLQEKEAIINILSSICDDDSVKEAFWPLFGDVSVQFETKNDLRRKD